MGKFNFTYNISNLNTSLPELCRFVSKIVDELTGQLDKSLTVSENLRSVVLEAVFTGSGIQIALPHSLRLKPTGYTVIGLSAAITVYDGVSANTDTSIYLRASGAGTAKILVFI